MVSALFTAFALIAAGQAEPGAVERDSVSNLRGGRMDLSWESPRESRPRSEGSRRRRGG